MSQASSVAPKRRSKKIWIFLVVGVLLAIAAAFVFFGDDVKVSFWINGLNSDQIQVREDNHKRLVGHKPGDAGVDSALLDAVWDTDRAWGVRARCTRILLERHRRGLLEKSLRTTEGFDRVVPVLERFSHDQFFKRTYADDPIYRVDEALRWWLANEDDDTRGYAIKIAIQLQRKDLMPLIRPLLVRRPDTTNAGRQGQSLVLQAAAAAVQRFKDCESLPAVEKLALEDPDPLVRMRAMQMMSGAAMAPEAACASTYPLERFRDVIHKNVADADKSVRMASMLEMNKYPALAEGLNGQLYEILDSDRDGSERRLAVEVLSRVQDADLPTRMGRYAHDRSSEVRSSVVAKSTLRDRQLLPVLIGTVRNEAESKHAFNLALEVLREVAGSWKGFSDELQTIAKRNKERWKSVRLAFFEAGEHAGISRQDLADAWFSWYVEHAGLSIEEQAAVIEARTQFWKAADAGNAKGAKAALDALDKAYPEVLLYEQGWLASR